MSQEPPWERAKRYQLMIAHHGFRSIRALAKAVGKDHSRVARILKILELPPSALEALQRNSDNARLRARFTEQRLRRMVMQDRPEAAILREIGQVTKDRV
jgi:ParB-like chromosome segregation protein Spo0J